MKNDTVTRREQPGPAEDGSWSVRDTYGLVSRLGDSDTLLLDWILSEPEEIENLRKILDLRESQV
jgi:hypothetical protein